MPMGSSDNSSTWSPVSEEKAPALQLADVDPTLGSIPGVLEVTPRTAEKKLIEDNDKATKDSSSDTARLEEMDTIDNQLELQIRSWGTAACSL